MSCDFFSFLIVILKLCSFALFGNKKTSSGVSSGNHIPVPGWQKKIGYSVLSIPVVFTNVFQTCHASKVN